MAGDWAIQRDACKVVKTDRKTGAAYPDEGKGVNIVHHDATANDRVAVDSRSSSLPAAPAC